MRLIIEARLEGAQTRSNAAVATVVAVVERQDRSVADLGLTLAEGRALLAEVQSVLVRQQTAGWIAGELVERIYGPPPDVKNAMRRGMGKNDSRESIRLTQC